LRLGLGISYPTAIPIGPINQVVKASDQPALTVITQGPVVKNALKALEGLENVDLFSILTLPILTLSPEILTSITHSKRVLVIEEHVERGGLAEYLLLQLTRAGLKLDSFEALNAKGYPSKTYGSQDFHWKESGLDIENIQKYILQLNT